MATIQLLLRGICNRAPVLYTFQVLLGEFLGLDYRVVESNPQRDLLTIIYGPGQTNHFQEKSLIIQAHTLWDNGWLQPSSMPGHPVRLYQTNESADSAGERGVPIIYLGGNHPMPFVDAASSHIRTNVDIIASSFFMLARYEEYVNADRDVHDRFPATASYAYNERFLHRPVVNEYLELLFTWLRRIAPSTRRRPRTFKLLLSHDVDKIHKYNRWQSKFRQLVFPQKQASSVSSFALLAMEKLAVHCKAREDPGLQRIKQMLKLEEGLGIRAFWFLRQGYKGQDAKLMSSDKRRRKQLGGMFDSSFADIGLHPSYDASYQVDVFRKELQLIRPLCNSDLWTRSHCLRFRVPQTWRILESEGVCCDTTLGYADRVGFRAGTCYEYHPYDVMSSRAFDITEYPLIVMDVTLREAKYEGLTPEAALAKTLHLADQCRNYNGNFTFLWHNTSFTEIDPAWNGWGDMYVRALERITQPAAGAHDA